MTIATKETEKLPSGPAVIPPGFYRELIRLAFPIALQSFLLAAVSASDTMMLVRLSQNAMSAVSLASHVQFVQNMLLMVITGAGMILGAQYYGKGDAEAIKALKNIMLRLGSATSVLFFLLCMLMPRSIMDIFTNQEELIQIGAGNLALGKAYGERLLRISLVIGLISCVLVLAVLPPAHRLSMLSDEAVGHLDKMLIIISVYMIARSANGIVINGIFASGGDTMFNMYSLATCMWGIAIPLSALGAFVFNWPVWLVYACTCLDEVGKIPWVLAHYKKYQWVRNLTRETLY